MTAPTPEERSLRRRVVYHGLRGHVADDTLRAAVALVDDEFANEAVFSVAKFLGRLAKRDASVAGQTARFQVALAQLRNRSADEIGPDPAPAPRATGAARPAAPVALEGGWETVLNELLGAVFAAVRVSAPERLAEVLRGVEARAATAAPNLRAPLLRTARIGEPDFGPQFDRAALHDAFHHFYLELCEQFGPVHTDRLVQRAVREVERLPLAGRFPPQALL